MPSGRSKIASIVSAVLLTAAVNCTSSTAAETQITGAMQRFLGSRQEDRFIDQSGHAIDFGRLADRVVVVTFFSTDCSISCVSRLLDLAAVVDALPAGHRSRVSVIALTVDPTHDTPGALEAFADGLKLDRGAVTLASGDPERVGAMLTSIGWRPADDGPDRAPPTLFVFDRRGAFAMRYGGVPLDRRRLGQDLSALADLDGGAGQSVTRVPTLR